MEICFVCDDLDGMNCFEKLFQTSILAGLTITFTGYEEPSSAGVPSGRREGKIGPPECAD